MGETINAAEYRQLQVAVGMWLDSYNPPEYLRIVGTRFGSALTQRSFVLILRVKIVEQTGRDFNQAEAISCLLRDLKRLAFEVFLHRGILIEPRVEEETE